MNLHTPEPLEARIVPATFTVSATADSGAGSLRQAILDANASPDASDAILFDFTADTVIAPLSALPSIGSGIGISGLIAVPNYHLPHVVLDGSLAGAGASGFTIAGNGSRIERMAVVNFPAHGIVINGSNNYIAGCYVGTDITLAGDLGNGGDGVRIESGSGNQIGSPLGVLTSAPNLIVSNGGAGVHLALGSTATTVAGNRIGIAFTDVALPNLNGVLIDGDSSANITEGNVISNNTDYGIRVNSTAAGNTSAPSQFIRGNFIGSGNGGLGDFGNGKSGIFILSAHGVRVGGTGVLSGTGASEGNIISGNGTYGVEINSGSRHQLYNNWIGIDSTGSAAVANNLSGVYVNGSSNNLIGSTSGHNVISGNGLHGVNILAGGSSNSIIGNYIGTDSTGSTAMGNTGDGIRIQSVPSTTIGGGGTNAGNVISGNGGDGIYVTGSTSATGTTLRQNFIGTTAAGTGDLGNGGNGIQFASVFGTASIGSAGVGNVIAGNGLSGILIGPGVGVMIQGNTIGLSGAANAQGILASGSGMLIGGVTVGQGNNVGFNTGAGIAVTGSTNAAILGNSLHDNGGLGIDLGNDGVTGNDSDDSDSGANGLLNFPVISSVAVTGTSALVSGTYTGLLDTELRLDFYSNSATGQAETYLGSMTVNTGPAGTVPFTKTFASVAAGRTISATATTTLTAGQTSEISAAVAQLPALTIADVSTAEGASGTTDFTFTLTLGAASATDVTVDFSTANATATAGSDFVATTGTLTFAAGELTKTITVPLLGDTTIEQTETLLLNLSNATGATISDSQAVGTITNDDFPTLTIANITANEVNVLWSTHTLTVLLSQVSPIDVSVDYTTAPDTAVQSPVPGPDYVGLLGTLTIPAGQTSGTFTVRVLGNTIAELTEQFFINLSNPIGATLADAHAVVTILDNDIATFTIDNVTMVEGNAGTTNAVFTVSQTTLAHIALSVDFATADGTATAGSDYTATTGTLTFAPGQSSQTISVPLLGDVLPENTETFFLNLSNAIGATITDAQGLATMSNDDYPALTIADLTQLEGTGGTTQFVFTVTMSEPAPYPVSMDYRTVAGTAQAGVDFTAVTGALTIPAGEVSGQIVIDVTGDILVEASKQFTVEIMNPVGGFISDFIGRGTILNDDTATLNVSSLSITEGNSGTKTATINILLSSPTESMVTFDFATRDGTAITGSDYIATSGSSGTFGGLTVQVQLLGDTRFSDNETFFLDVTNIVGAVAGVTSGTVTILNDDAAATITVSDVSSAETDSGTKPFVFTVQLSGGLESAITIPYSTDDGTALAVSDFESTSGAISLAAGETSATVTVNVNGDTLPEPNEDFLLTLGTIAGAPAGMSVLRSSATGTILGDDYIVSVAGGSFAESGNYEITFSILGSPTTKITVNFMTRSETATEGMDFRIPIKPVIFHPGETSKVVALPLIDDDIHELSEQFFVDITSANALIGTGTAEITILDNDAPTVSLISGGLLPNLEDGADDAGRIPFVVFLSEASAVPITVRVKTAPGSAGSADFLEIDEVITFAPGTTVFDSEVVITADHFAERDETFTLSLSDGVNVVVDSEATLDLTIRDNDGLTISKNKKTATWRDFDGDLVTLKVTKPVLTPAMFTFRYGEPIGTGEQIAGQLLESLNLTSAFFTAEKTDISIQAKRKGGLGDGRVNVGAIDATGMNLGAVSIAGDLGRINAGHQVNGTGVKSLTLGSLGDFGTSTQPAGGNLVSSIKGNLGKLKVTGNVSDATLRIGGSLIADGNLGSVSIGGSLRGGDGDGIFASGRIGKVSIARDILGTSPLDAVSITAVGERLPTSATIVAIAGLTVGGLVANAEVLAGYTIDGAALNPNASIGAVKVKQTWTASTLAAGIARGNDGLFGTGDDKRISATAPALVARIASITIGGEVSGTASTGDHFGFIAGVIGSAKINGFKLPLTSNRDFFGIVGVSDVNVIEVHPATPPNFIIIGPVFL